MWQKIDDVVIFNRRNDVTLSWVDVCDVSGEVLGLL